MLESRSNSQDDEHYLIARYASRLAADKGSAVRWPITAYQFYYNFFANFETADTKWLSGFGYMQHTRVPTDLSLSLDTNKQQRQLIAELESKNK